MSDLEEYETARRSILQVMNEAGLQVGSRLHELQTRAHPDAWAGIAGYLKPSLLTGEQRIVDLLVALHPGATTGIEMRGQQRLRVQFRGVVSTGVHGGWRGDLVGPFPLRVSNAKRHTVATRHGVRTLFLPSVTGGRADYGRGRHSTVGKRPGVRAEISRSATSRGSTSPPRNRRSVRSFTPVGRDVPGVRRRSSGAEDVRNAGSLASGR